MKFPRFLLLLVFPLLLAGCQTINQKDQRVLRAHNVPGDVYDKMLYGDPLSLDDVIALSRRAVPSGLIIHYMDEIGTGYRLRKADVKRLRAAGVGDDVIDYMLSTAPAYGPGYEGGYPNAGPYAGPYPGPYPYDPYYYDYYPYYGPVVIAGYGRWGWGHGGGWNHGGWGHGGHHH